MSQFSKGKNLIFCLLVTFSSLFFAMIALFGVAEIKQINNTMESPKAALNTYNEAGTIIGAGTETNPYHIYSGQGLDWAYSQSHAGPIYAVLEQDINYISNYGIYTQYSTIILDGNYKKIHISLTCNMQKNIAGPVGLFQRVNYLNVKNLYLTGGVIATGYPSSVGGLAGMAVRGAIIQNCWSDMEIKMDLTELSGKVYASAFVGSVGLDTDSSTYNAKVEVKDTFYCGQIVVPNYNKNNVVVNHFANQHFRAKDKSKTYEEISTTSQYFYYTIFNGNKSALGGSSSLFFDAAYKAWIKDQTNNFVPMWHDSGLEYINDNYKASIIQISFLVNRQNIEDDLRIIKLEFEDQPSGFGLNGDLVYYYMGYYDYKFESTGVNYTGVSFTLEDYGITNKKTVTFSSPKGWSILDYYTSFSEKETVFTFQFQRLHTFKIGGIYYNGNVVDSSIAVIDSTTGADPAYNLIIYFKPLVSDGNSHKLNVEVWLENFNKTYTLTIKDAKYTLKGWYVETTTANDSKKIENNSSLDDFVDAGNDYEYIIYPILELKTYGVDLG